MKRTDRTLADFRFRLTSGEYAPGNRLPVREELETRFGISRGSMQRVINQLTDEGFLVARGSKGMFVADYPPHLKQFGLILPPRRKGVIQDSFWQKLIGLTENAACLPAGVRFRVYQAQQEEATGVWEQIDLDIAERRLAGVLLLEHKQMPEIRLRRLAATRVAIVSHVEYEDDWLRSVWPDYSALIRRAVGAVRAAGAQSAALLANIEVPPEYLQEFSREAGENGVQTRPEWIQGVALSTEGVGWIRRIVRLLFSPNQQERPQALVVLNENFTPHVMSALSELKLQREVRVVSHSNGDRPDAAVRYICFDLRQLLTEILRVLSDWPAKTDGNWPRRVAPENGGQTPG